MNIHDLIANEFVETKLIASFIYLVELVQKRIIQFGWIKMNNLSIR